LAVTIIPRTLASGERRFHVRYRAGRYEPILHLGAFKTKKLAEKCQEWAEGELAEGRVPDRRRLLRSQLAGQASTISTLADEWFATRVDLAERTHHEVATRLRMARTSPLWGMQPTRVTPADVQAFIAWLEKRGLSPGTIRHYVLHARQILDYAEVEPNPARDRRVRLPRAQRVVIQPPQHDEVAAILRAIPDERTRLMVALLEACGLRISEACALAWGSLHPDELIVEKGKTSGARRSVPIDPALVQLLGHRGDRFSRVFPGATRTKTDSALRRAAAKAGVDTYSAHDLRHRYVSRLVLQGVPIVEVQRRVGHAKASITLDVYSHVRCDTREAWKTLLE
jgi:integrase